MVVESEPTIAVQFEYTLRQLGTKVRVFADVGQDVDIKQIIVGEGCDALPMPTEFLQWRDRCAIHFAASDEYYAELRRRKESA